MAGQEEIEEENGMLFFLPDPFYLYKEYSRNKEISLDIEQR